MTLSNLPPGVTDSMIPGNRSEDLELEVYLEHWAALVNDEYGVYDEWPEKWDAWAILAFDNGIKTSEGMRVAIRGYEEEAIEMMRLLK
jgi:hypothetical protein